MSTKQQDTDKLDAESGNVEQIREILFGANIRAFDKRFSLVESRLAKETETLHKAIEKRVLKLERVVTDFHEQSTDLVGAEASNRELGLNKLEMALAEVRVESETRMAAMEERIAGELKEITATIKAMHKELADALAKAEREQDKRSDKLEQDKVARKDLSAMFTNMAKSLAPGKTGRAKK